MKSHSATLRIVKPRTIGCRSIACLLMAIAAPSAYPATFNIPNGDVAALKGAINAANANNEDDTIELASNGTYTPLTADNSTFGPTALPVVAADNNHSLTINGHNATLQGRTGQRILAGSGAKLRINGGRFVGGGVSGAGVQGQGGAVYLTNGSLEVSQSVFMDTVARQGGAIYANGGVLLVTTVSFTSHRAEEEGGCIFNNFAQATIVEGYFEAGFYGNLASRGALIANLGSATIERGELSGGDANEGGGAVWNSGSLVVRNSIFAGNRGFVRGGAILNESRVDLIGSSFSGNNAPAGGALYDASTAAGYLRVSNCAFIDNLADQGGAMAKFQGTDNTVGAATFTNNTLHGNGTNLQRGPVFYLSALPPNPTRGLVTLINNTVNNTRSTTSSGAFHVTGPGIGLSLTNNLLQRGAGLAPMFFTANSGSITSQGHNLSSEAAGGDDMSGPGGFLNAPGDRRNTYPDLETEFPQNNGGPTVTFALRPTSPAVDQAKAIGLTRDQRGHGRPEDREDVANAVGGDGSDIGSYELGGGISQSGPSLLVTVIDDRDDGDFNACSTGDCTLREAIRLANALSGDNAITFAAGIEGTIELRSPLPNLSTNIALLGPGAERVTVRRSLGVYRIFTIGNGTSIGPTITITGLTISSGDAPSGSFPASAGGGIYNDRGALTLRNCALNGNRANSFGGGIFNEGFGGSAPLTIENCTFNGNTAVANGGGGLFNSVAAITITNCTFSGNSAGFGGGAFGSSGALSGASASVTLRNCTINASTGGGIANGFNSALTLSNNILAGSSGANVGNSGSVTSQGHNLSNDNGGGFLTASGDQINTDPMLEVLANNGGPTQTHALLAGSPAINMGDNTLAPPLDQRGYRRVSTSDIGAFEFGGGPIRITSITRLTNGHIMLEGLGATSSPHTVHASATLAPDSIGSIGTATSNSSGIWQFEDTGATGLTKRFYRVSYP